jgi:hypothetical protein
MKRNASQSAPRGRKSNSTFAHACQNSDDREICPTEAVRGFEISAFLRRDFDGRNRTNTQVCLQDRLVTLPKKSICSWGSTRCWCIRKKTPVFLAIVKRKASQSAPRGRKSNSTFAHACQNSDDRGIGPTEAVRGFEISAFLRSDFDGRNRTNTQVCLQDRLVALPKKSICSWGSTRCCCIRKKTPVFLATMKRNAP